MDEPSESQHVDLLDQYAMAVLSGLCANPSVAGASEQQLVSKAFLMARYALHNRLICSDPYQIVVFVIMNRDRYIHSVDRNSKFANYTKNVREGNVYYNEQTARSDCDFTNTLRMNTKVVRTTAELFPSGKCVPEPANDWAEQQGISPEEAKDPKDKS